MKKYLRIFFLLIAVLFIPLNVFAVDVNTAFQQSAKQYNVTFPIKELGGCNNYSECHAFCDDPVHQKTCIDFAKTKKFYRGDTYRQNRAIALSNVKQVLGCDSEGSCQAFCEKSENQQKCTDFARQHNLTPPKAPDPSQSTILQKAKDILGCSSEMSCKDFCSQQNNKEKCNNFAKQEGLRGGTVKRGPGGCSSEETCQLFCSDPNNFTPCSQFFKSYQKEKQNTQEDRGSFKGPGDCNSENSCRTYCNEHPQECSNFRPSSSLSPTSSTNQTTSFPQATYDTTSTDPASYCKQTTGCTWTGITCQCSNNPASANQTGNQPSYSAQTPSSASLVDCVGPDGKHFQTTQKACSDLNAAWGKSSNQQTGSSSQSTDYNSLSNGQLITCTGPDGKQFQATQQQCDYFNNAWKNTNSNTSSGSTSTNYSQSGGSSSYGSSAGSGSGGCDTSCQQSYCSKCGGTWSGGTCVNAHC